MNIRFILSCAALLLLVRAASAQPKAPRPTSEDDEDRHAQMLQRTEPSVVPPTDPLAVSPTMKATMGTDYDGPPPGPERTVRARSFAPVYSESLGDYRLKLLPPFWLEHTRGVGTDHPDRQSLYGLMYYQRRSKKKDADVLFPLVWHTRDERTHTTVVGPVVHREGPKEWDNWLAPLVFAGKRDGGGYLHAPLLLTTAHWSRESSFALVGPYFRDRTGTDVDWGVAPLYFHGDNGNVEGNRKTYTVIPPLFYYHRARELEGAETTIAGPFIFRETEKRSIFDIAPFYFHIRGKPESGGVRESHTTLLPFFHYGYSPNESLLVLPGYLRRTTERTDTLLTPFYSRLRGRGGATSLTAVGPVVPLFYQYKESDTGLNAWALAPFYYQSESPVGRDMLTPLFGRFETYGVSRSYWIFPTITTSRDVHGWETNIHPLVYTGRSDRDSHTVLAPIFWDFASPKSRTTIGFPLYWRFRDTGEGTVTQVLGNTLYRELPARGGKSWEFHFLPLFSYGQSPGGHFWNVLMGLVGYTSEDMRKTLRALWLPIPLSDGSTKAALR